MAEVDAVMNPLIVSPPRASSSTPPPGEDTPPPPPQPSSPQPEIIQPFQHKFEVMRLSEDDLQKSQGKEMDHDTILEEDEGKENKA